MTSIIKHCCQNPAVAGLLQAAGILLYVMLITQFFVAMPMMGFEVVGESFFLFHVFFLSVFVFSAAVTSLMFFGFPVYLFLHAQLKKAFLVMGYTIAWMFAFLILLWLVLFIMGL